MHAPQRAPRQLDPNGEAAQFGISQNDCPAMGLDNRFHDRQAQPGPFSALAGGVRTTVESFEGMLLFIIGQSHSVILDDDR